MLRKPAVVAMGHRRREAQRESDGNQGQGRAALAASAGDPVRRRNPAVRRRTAVATVDAHVPLAPGRVADSAQVSVAYTDLGIRTGTVPDRRRSPTCMPRAPRLIAASVIRRGVEPLRARSRTPMRRNFRIATRMRLGAAQPQPRLPETSKRVSLIPSIDGTGPYARSPASLSESQFCHLPAIVQTFVREPRRVI